MMDQMLKNIGKLLAFRIAEVIIHTIGMVGRINLKIIDQIFIVSVDDLYWHSRDLGFSNMVSCLLWS
jgi:hypothetical protein